jgi:hypothetical protein
MQLELLRSGGKVTTWSSSEAQVSVRRVTRAVVFRLSVSRATLSPQPRLSILRAACAAAERHEGDRGLRQVV